MNLSCCTARGYDPDHREQLRKDDSTHFLRTDYCRKHASDQWQVTEICPKCNGRCEGERHSYQTRCTECGAKFVRVNNQDEHYLREEK